MKKEIEVAVNWWKNALKDHNQGAGDAEKIEAFGVELEKRLPKFFTDHGWKIAKDVEGWAVVSRVLATDYGPNVILGEAASAAGITQSIRFPNKTVMWVYPGKVSVSYGYAGEELVVWEELRRSCAPDTGTPPHKV